MAQDGLSFEEAAEEIESQAGNIKAMIDKIAALLCKPSDGYDKELNKALRCDLLQRQKTLNALLRETNGMRSGIIGMSRAQQIRHQLQIRAKIK